MPHPESINGTVDIGKIQKALNDATERVDALVSNMQVRVHGWMWMLDQWTDSPQFIYSRMHIFHTIYIMIMMV